MTDDSIRWPKNTGVVGRLKSTPTELGKEEKPFICVILAITCTKSRYERKADLVDTLLRDMDGLFREPPKKKG